MKRIITTAIALALACGMTASAFAMEVPEKITVQNLNGVQQYIKEFTVSGSTDPENLIEEDFSYEGFRYTYSGITKTNNFIEDTKEMTQVITVNTEKKDLSVILENLEPEIWYEDEHYSGKLYLDHTSLVTEAAGYKKVNYTLTETREYSDLDSNDMAYVAETTTKDGKTLPLVGVDWQVQATTLVDDVLVPSKYMAVATYADKTSYSAATGYITTAEYKGDVRCYEVADVTYIVTYTGTSEKLPVYTTFGSIERSTPDTDSGAAAPSRLMIIGGVLVLAVITGSTVHAIQRKKKEDKENEEEQ